MSIEQFAGFFVLALLATATPGPAAMLVAVNGLALGFKAAMLTILGNVTGLFLMSLLSVLGLSTLVTHSTGAFLLVKVLGPAYLIYMGWKLWRNGLLPPEPPPLRKHRLYLQGIVVALTNPKAILFTTALFPQFIDLSRPLYGQFIILVGAFMLMSMMSLSVYALMAVRLGQVSHFSKFSNWLGKCFGVTFIGAGCLLASTNR